MKQFTVPTFVCLTEEKLPNKSEAKLRADAFEGTQIGVLMQDNSLIIRRIISKEQLGLLFEI